MASLTFFATSCLMNGFKYLRRFIPSAAGLRFCQAVPQPAPLPRSKKRAALPAGLPAPLRSDRAEYGAREPKRLPEQRLAGPRDGYPTAILRLREQTHRIPNWSAVWLGSN